jgi:hypothetical protein
MTVKVVLRFCDAAKGVLKLRRYTSPRGFPLYGKRCSTDNNTRTAYTIRKITPIGAVRHARLPP